STEAWLCAVSYTLQLYFDFSGYCDMALGVSKMFNIDLPLNFNSPYKSLSITEFWKGWHITLTRFLRKYIYFPLGGSRKGTLRTYLNIMVIFVVSGFWHGAEWSFVLWGALHGVVMILNRIFKKQWDSLHAAFRWTVNFLLVVLGWVFFRAEDITDAINYLGRMVNTAEMNLSGDFYNSFGLSYYPLLSEHLNYVVPLLFVVALHIVMNMKNVYEREYKPGVLTGVITVLLFLGSFMMMSDVGTFVYFNF
ncbi:MAG: MBOAT family protein, partial [Lachnospiraceae bacterium]|nr:MBOAT family protein [Lachnospiraceae bacterium]